MASRRECMAATNRCMATTPRKESSSARSWRFMFSLETMLGDQGRHGFCRSSRTIAYNALPTQTTEDFRQHQYFQCANQVLVHARRGGTSSRRNGMAAPTCFGLLNGYPCCTCNMHQGWPKLVQNLWHATPDGGLAALVYAPCEVACTPCDGVRRAHHRGNSLSFEESIRFRVSPRTAGRLSLRLRVPGWAKSVTVKVNGQDSARRRSRTADHQSTFLADGDVCRSLLRPRCG